MHWIWWILAEFIIHNISDYQSHAGDEIKKLSVVKQLNSEILETNKGAINNYVSSNCSQLIYFLLLWELQNMIFEGSYIYDSQELFYLVLEHGYQMK